MTRTAFSHFLLVFLLELTWNVALCTSKSDFVFVNAEPPPGSTEIAVRRVDVLPKCAHFAMKTKGCDVETVKPRTEGGYDCKCFKIMPDNRELAQGKPCSQSSLYDDHTSCDSMIDGSVATTWSSWSCFNSATETNPWWQMDLQGYYTVTHITVLTRSDCCHSFLTHINILIGMSAHEKESGQLCKEDILPSYVIKREIPCIRPIKGRFVFMQRVVGVAVLTMCEVKVYGR